MNTKLSYKQKMRAKYSVRERLSSREFNTEEIGAVVKQIKSIIDKSNDRVETVIAVSIAIVIVLILFLSMILTGMPIW